MLFFFWKKKGIFPSDIMARSAGEKLVLRAFFELEVEEHNRALAKYSKDAMPMIDITNM